MAKINIVPASFPTTTDAKSIFYIALNFETSSSVLDQANAKVFSNLQGPVKSPYLVPSVVCRAFSIELLLKCLALIETGKIPKNIHELDKLFDRLSPESKGKIKNTFDTNVAKNPQYRAMQNFFKDVPLSFELNNVLKVISKVFVTWRYFHENNAGSSYCMPELGAAIRERVIELQPDIQLKEESKSLPEPANKPLKLIIIDTTGRLSLNFGGGDLEWDKFILMLSPAIKSTPKGIQKISHTNFTEYKLIDIDKKCWLNPPMKMSILSGKKIALIHNEIMAAFKIPKETHEVDLLLELFNLG